jgi:hypothetical protein
MNNSFSNLLAKQLHDVYFGGNWTSVNVQKTLEDVDWIQATTRIESLNTIAVLVNHINYYIGGVVDVLIGKPLLIKDKYSFEHPPINNQEDWLKFISNGYHQVHEFISEIEKLTDDQIKVDFIEPKYGTWFRNLSGIIEHCHYHLGQIVIIKKLVSQGLH